MATTKRVAKRAATKRASTKQAEPGRREQNKQATRQRIVESALELFQSRGFEATTTKQIARRAKIAEGTVFNYFPTKDDIALSFFEAEVDHAIAAVRKDRALRRRPLEEKLFALVQHQLDYLAPYEHFIGSALVEALKPGSRLGPFSQRSRELQQRYLDFVRELIDESSKGRDRDVMGVLGPHAFWIFYLGVLLYWLHDGSTGKQSTLALLDRSLKIGVALLGRRAR